MNAAIRSVVRIAIAKGLKISGIYYTYNGLVKHDIGALIVIEGDGSMTGAKIFQ
tara:strand:- start:448 stop:609 length:162 start_codon:yes stop_codon:yes gene_type:complete